MKVAVVGLGYVGIPVAAALASSGVRVVGIDIDAAKVEAVTAGRSPLEGEEPGLEDVIAQGVARRRLTATRDHAAVGTADVVIVGTPHREYKDLRVPPDKIVVDIWNIFGKGCLI